MTVLGIETSCDETAAAVVSRAGDGSGVIRSNIVLSQLAEHAAFGGVVPEIAARAHVTALDGVIAAALRDAGTEWDDLDAIAVTAGPGLIGGLLVGTVTAAAIAAARGLALMPVNHLEGHALTASLTDGLAFPYLLLLVSGGHSQFLLVEGVGRYKRLGSTIDDALGEAFDKTAKLLGLAYPGGPSVECCARHGNPRRFDLPRPLKGSAGCDFSFSGLKTAVRQAAEANAPLSDQDLADLCASFQMAVGDVLEDRLRHAVAACRSSPDGSPGHLVAAGGVAANLYLGNRLEKAAAALGLSFIAPALELCTDNAAMIAWAGALRLVEGYPATRFAAARARWPLDETAEPVIGAGRKGARA
ncbi:MAG: tRNA (adenosine(37)-N6)-threonylcarbamoyltransferase complex transferase subunit TsaD [Hyphomicrobiales bacterium]|nr:tRNA (adenosine(37)-N6)-threonylcarbamoyltransferase complex transferase subunit TsaD [Hyphomicrobiales bacterium]